MRLFHAAVVLTGLALAMCFGGEGGGEKAEAEAGIAGKAFLVDGKIWLKLPDPVAHAIHRGEKLTINGRPKHSFEVAVSIGRKDPESRRRGPPAPGSQEK